MHRRRYDRSALRFCGRGLTDRARRLNWHFRLEHPSARALAIVLIGILCGALIVGLPANAASIAISPAGSASSPSATAPTDERANATIFDHIKTYRHIADKIQVDGYGADWDGMPFVIEDRPVGSGPVTDPRRRIIKVSIAIRQADILVLIKTAEKPLLQEHEFGGEFSLSEWYCRDVSIIFGINEDHWLYLGNNRVEVPHSAITVRVRDCIEARIPFQVLDKYLPAKLSEALHSVRSHPWLRFFSESWDGMPNVPYTSGPAVAAYRLLDEPYDLDPPIVVMPPFAPHPIPVTVPLPVDHQWFVSDGPFGSGSHHAMWACDLMMADAALKPEREPHGNRQEAYYGWRQPIFAPAGKVTEVLRDCPDNAIPDTAHTNNLTLPANYVMIDLGNGFGLQLVHMRQSSVPPAIQAGTKIKERTPVGEVGDSGPSGGPHLHINTYEHALSSQTVPLAFTHVRVSLNPGEDPWVRDLDTWEPRDGVFIQSQPTP